VTEVAGKKGSILRYSGINRILTLVVYYAYHHRGCAKRKVMRRDSDRGSLPERAEPEYEEKEVTSGNFRT
jgi:hypothetical protein